MSFLGIFQPGTESGVLEREVSHSVAGIAPSREPSVSAVFVRRGIALCPAGPPDPGTKHPTPISSNEDGSIAVVCSGRIFNGAELRGRARGRDVGSRPSPSELLLGLYERDPDGFLHDVNGGFSFALWDGREGRLILGRDRLGIEPLYYARRGGRLLFGSSPRILVEAGGVAPEMNPNALVQYLLFCFNPSLDTFVRGVRKVPPGHLVIVDRTWDGSEVPVEAYWKLSFAEPRPIPEEQIHAEVLELMRDAVRIRLEDEAAPGAFLSGGTDSSAIVSMASQASDAPLHTFSFRCGGLSYDESVYARFVADTFGTEHVEISYTPESLTLIDQAAPWMDEPFCDIGIEIGTFLLGQAAGGTVSCAFSGEGGDELFGGHPFYVADKAAALVDRVPEVLVRPVARAVQRLSDSDQKKDLRVKVKRFGYGLGFPRALLSHRWRTYYTPDELGSICTPGLLEASDSNGLFDSVLVHYQEADGPDLLARTLYADYQTLVDFYLRRLRLLRAHSVESRLPLLDHRLVEYAARIPSRLKLRGWSDTKYVYRRLLEDVLPRRILHDRPKLGHSVPVKNWLRESGPTRDWVVDTLSSQAFRSRGWFEPSEVERMLDEHARRVRNHSHRIWALMVLESWFLRNFEEWGRRPVPAVD
jgi:asparagine synthase (glutamine-hydrolysing)